MSHFMAVSPRGARAGRRVASLALRVISLALALLLSLPAAPLRAAEAPTPLAPLAGDTITPTEATPLAIPEFRWKAVGGATLYRLQFANNPGFAAPFEYTTANTVYTPLDASRFTDGTWYWRVKVDKPASAASEYSAVESFRKDWATCANWPQLLDPPGGASLAFFENSMFSWEPVLGAASYRLQIAASADSFATPLYSAETLATVHQPTAKRADGTYYWRVIPLDAKGRAGCEKSEVRPFEVKYNQTPSLLEPDDYAQPTFTPTLRWKAVQGAEYYTLQYSTDPIFAANVITVKTCNTTYTPPNDLPNDVNYYWRVQARSGASVGPWTASRMFVKHWYLPPTLLTPTNFY